MTDFTDFLVVWGPLLRQLIPHVLDNSLLPRQLVPHLREFKLARLKTELHRHLPNLAFVSVLACSAAAADDVCRPLVVNVGQPQKATDVQTQRIWQTASPGRGDRTPIRRIQKLGLERRSGSPLVLVLAIYLFDIVEDEMVRLCDCRWNKVHQRGDEAHNVVALVPRWLIRMLKRVHVEVVLDDEMSPRADVLLRLVVGNMDNLAAGILEHLEDGHSRVIVPVHLEPLLSPKGNRGDVLNVSGRRCGNIGKHLERKEVRMDILARVPIRTWVVGLTLQFFPKQSALV